MKKNVKKKCHENDIGFLSGVDDDIIQEWIMCHIISNIMFLILFCFLLKNEAYGNMTSVYLSYWENVINFYEYETFSDPVLKRRFDRQATPGTTALNETSQDEVTNLLVKEVLGKYKFCHVQLNKTLIVFLYSFVWVLFENRPALHFCNYIKKTIHVYWIPYLLMIL